MSDYLAESRRATEADLLVALEAADTVDRALMVSRYADGLLEFCRVIEREARQKAHELSLQPKESHERHG